MVHLAYLTQTKKQKPSVPHILNITYRYYVWKYCSDSFTDLPVELSTHLISMQEKTVLQFYTIVQIASHQGFMT